MTNNTGTKWRGLNVKQKVPNYSNHHYALFIPSTVARQRILGGN